MKKTDFDNLRAATTARPSETEALFSNEFKLFTESLTKPHHLQFVKNRMLESLIIATLINFSWTLLIKATFMKFSLTPNTVEEEYFINKEKCKLFENC